ncbi:MAG: ABC transporter ATP-binding protein [Candidatus Bathyarchaeia archaeon]
MNTRPPMIKTEHLQKVFSNGSNSIHVFDDVNIEIQKGEFAAIMGPTGSGKTTLLNLLAGLDKPTGGKVIVDNVDLSTLNDDQLTELRVRKMGIVFQFYNLIPSLNVLENVELPLLFMNVPREEREVRALRVLDAVGLGNRYRDRIAILSGGELQMVAIARALVTEPPIILLDEPTGNLDAFTIQDLLVVFRGLHILKNRTIIVATHNRKVAEAAKHIINLRKRIPKNGV